MRLTFIYQPVADLKEALALYRDRFGFEEAWREGDTTAAVRLPGTEVQLMLDQSTGDDRQPAGPVFEVEDVAAYRAEHADLAYSYGPVKIPGGSWTSFVDPSGNTIHIADQDG